MIKIDVYRDGNGFIWSIKVQGHSGYAPAGEDIICAAISALSYTAAGALAELAGIGDYSERDGYMLVNVPKDIKDELKPLVKVILETIVIGFKQIEGSYGDFVKVKEQEV